MKKMQLETARLCLRRAQPDDLAALHRIMSQPEVMRFWSQPEHDHIDQTAEYLQTLISGGARSDEFVITRDGLVIGKAGMWQAWEIGFFLSRDYWGMGLAKEALTALLAHLFESHPTDALTAEVDPRNLRSLRLLHQLGFIETGRASRTLLWRDEWCDSIYLRLTRRPVGPDLFPNLAS